tara:strand:- start:1231 stop:1461 length:231 start_codon:yes stop_codon:yes gene_type:complete
MAFYMKGSSYLGGPITHTSTALVGAKKHNAKHAANPSWEHKERNLGKNIKKVKDKSMEIGKKVGEKISETIKTIKE